jgi:hypothetical protein
MDTHPIQVSDLGKRRLECHQHEACAVIRVNANVMVLSFHCQEARARQF